MTGLIVLAKRPVAGRVKTRLCPPLTPRGAALVAAAALSDTMDAVDSLGATDRLLCFDGSARGWRRLGWRVCAQKPGTLDVRLAGAFAAVRGPSLLVWMDTPQLDAEALSAFDPTRFDACLGPTNDGGYWAIGLRDPRRAQAAIHGVPMSTTDTFDAQYRRLVGLGLSVQLLDPQVDVDTIDDAHLVAADAPHTRFAACLADQLAVPERV